MLLATAAAAGGLAVAAGRRFATRVELALAVGVESILAGLHHRIREACAAILRHYGASAEAEKQ
jgi:hypothetical protein